MPLVAGLIGGAIAGAIIVVLVVAPRDGRRDAGTSASFGVSGTGVTTTAGHEDDPRLSPGSGAVEPGAGQGETGSDLDARHPEAPESGSADVHSGSETPSSASAGEATPVTQTEGATPPVTPVRSPSVRRASVPAHVADSNPSRVTPPDRSSPPSADASSAGPPAPRPEPSTGGSRSGAVAPPPSRATASTPAGTGAGPPERPSGSPSTRPAAPETSTPATSSPKAEDATDEEWPLLCGIVQDESGAPIAGARVLLADLDLGARTDRLGRSCISAPTGSRTLSVIALGFSTHRRIVTVANGTPELKIVLKGTP